MLSNKGIKIAPLGRNGLINKSGNIGKARPIGQNNAVQIIPALVMGTTTRTAEIL
jgi:hypothetical protein